MKKIISKTLALTLLLSASPLASCGTNGIFSTKKPNVLRVASWDEYIDMGGEFYADDDENPELMAFKAWYKETFGITLSEDTKPLSEEFVDWYHANYKGSENYQKDLVLQYIPLQDNETMYNKIKMGDRYDLLCPSEYMAMKLKAEGLLIPYDTLLDETIENNYYVKNASKYSKSIFESAGLSEYIAGYMWGTTGFVFNPNKIGKNAENAREIMKSWCALYSPETKNKITAKDNARDSYFMGLGMHYEQQLLQLKQEYNAGNITKAEYQQTLADKMNDTNNSTTDKVKDLLKKMRKNVYGLETDEGKMDVVTGLLDASYQWSGDAVYMINEAEFYDLELEYSIPDSASNIWFDGWVMMEDANKELAAAFINFISMPQNVVRNMYYIGYTSCLSSEEIFDYVAFTYEADSSVNITVPYDLSYFFGDNHILNVAEEQTRRQLFAQYPRTDVTDRLVVMKYFEKEANERINRMWINIK